MAETGTGLGRKLRERVAESYGGDSAAKRTRSRRWDVMRATFPEFEDMRVIDLGGDVRYWTSAPMRPAHLTIVDIEADRISNPEPWMTVIQGDATEELDVGTFDLCHSNSVIEHVGGPARRAAFAANVHKLAPRHWVQTPYRYFPVEPHWIFPGMQFLPLPLRWRISKYWPLGPAERHHDHVFFALHVELLTRTEMRYLFPGSELVVERFAGLTKSLTAVKA